MRAFIINGAASASEFTVDIARCAASSLRSNKWQVDSLDAYEKEIGACVACGACSDRTPGICVQKDDGRVAAERSAECDLMIFVSRIEFGCYSSSAKRAIERTMPNIHPLFLKYRGELHHRYRYEKSPSLLVLGWQPQADENETRIFRKTAERNAINYLSPWHASLVFSGTPEPQILSSRISSAIAVMKPNAWQSTPMLAFPKPESGPFGDAATPVLLIGASNRKNGNSKAIMEYLAKRLADSGAKCQTLDLSSGGFMQGKAEVLLDAVCSAGRIIFISPLYHDTLTYTAIRAMESLREHEPDIPKAITFSAIIHSGYPEPVHTRTALAACRYFATRIGWKWQGGLTAGASSPIGGQPLEKGGRITKHLRLGLDIASHALAQGQPLPDEAVASAAKCFVPAMLFRWAANRMMRSKARSNEMDISARPYAGAKSGR